MTLVFAGIAPHGVALIPALSEDADGGLQTRAAMELLGQCCAAARPEVIVVATPHGTRVDGHICLVSAARAAGTLRWQERQVELNVPVDQPFTDHLAEVARMEGIPVALASWGGNQRSQSSMLLDWGTFVPLWFLGYNTTMPGTGDPLASSPEHDHGPHIVIAAPSRRLPRIAMMAFGRAIATVAAQDERRIAFVASCDWAHTHQETGPYGFHPAAVVVDRIVLDALQDNDPARLMNLPAEQVEAAAVDGLWQALMLAGVLQHTPLVGEVLSYEAPTYFGMLVAQWRPVANQSS